MLVTSISLLSSTLYSRRSHGTKSPDALVLVLQEWELDPSKQVAITTDSGSNIVLACRLLNWLRKSCFGHNLDLAVRKGLCDAHIDRVISLCKKVVSSFSSSWKRKRDLHAIQEQNGLPTKKLKADVSTQWGSTGAMMERIIEQMDIIHVVLGQDRKVSHLVPSWQDLDVLSSVVAAIGPLQEITDILSGEQRITCSAIKPLLDVPYDKMLATTDDETSLTQEIKGRIESDLQSRYLALQVDLLLDKCSFWIQGSSTSLALMMNV